MVRRGLGLVAALLTMALVLPGAPGAHAAAFEASGWWWRLQAGLLTSVPAPPYVPEGGLYVAGAPEGPVAVAALRFRLDEDETDPVLTLTVAEERGGEAARLLACNAATPWIPAEAAPWDDRPEAGCPDGEVEAERSEDGSQWTVPLAALVRGQRLDVVLTPGELPDAPGWSSFELAFEPIDHDALQTTVPTADAGFDEGPSVPTFEPAAPASGPAPPPASGGFAPQTFEAPVAETEPDVAGPAAAPPEADTHVGEGSAAAPPSERPAAPQELAADGDPARLLGVLVVALALAAVYLLSQQPTPAVAGLGRFSGSRAAVPEAQPGGLGRFARPRHGPPPPLR